MGLRVTCELGAKNINRFAVVHRCPKIILWADSLVIAPDVGTLEPLID